MNIRTGVLFILLLVLWNPVIQIASSQQNQGSEPLKRNPQNEEAELKLRVDLVVVDAQVLQQKTGRIIGNLRKEDFHLFEDGIKQEVTHFSQDSLPLSVILLVDRAGCLDPFSEKVHQATLEALQRLKPNDEVALMTFADHVELVKGFRYDRQTIADAIDRMPEHNEHGEHCLNLAFYEAAQYMRKAGNPSGRRVIIAITGITKSFDCSGPSGQETQTALFESGSVVCGIVPRTAEQRLENGLTSGAATVAGMFKVHSTSLNHLAEETGGEVVNTEPEKLNHAFNDLVNHLRTRYSLGYTSSNQKLDGRFRKLKLEVSSTIEKREGKLVVQTRRGYIASRVTTE